jgi:hypothetical protein
VGYRAQCPERQSHIVGQDVLPEVLGLRRGVRRVTEMLDQFRGFRQQFTVNIAVHTALVRLFVSEQKCITMRAYLRFTTHCLTEHRHLSVFWPVIGEL